MRIQWVQISKCNSCIFHIDMSDICHLAALGEVSQLLFTQSTIDLTLEYSDGANSTKTAPNCTLLFPRMIFLCAPMSLYVLSYQSVWMIGVGTRVPLK